MRSRRFDQINVLPFIDIMLVLLVIVLTTASFVAKGTIPIDLPEAKSGKAPPKEPLVIAIDQKGLLYYEGNVSSMERLRGILDGLDPKKDALLIRSDAKSEFEKFVNVIDLLKERGFASVSIETKR